jgi:hypothetical protein
VPYALGGTALLVIGQFAAVKLDFQHFAECCPSVQWDESENVVGYAGTGGCAAGVPSHSGCRSNIEVMIVAIDVRIALRRGSRIFAQKNNRECSATRPVSSWHLISHLQYKFGGNALHTIHKKRTCHIPAWRSAQNEVCLNGVGHDRDRPNAGSSDAFRVAGRMAEMKMLDKTEQSEWAPNSNDKPESCYCSALPKGSGLCLPCYTRWLVGKRS